ncbi:hypothetical protein A6770_22790 [Nostoc minutum NIES-26]|uniref:Uncharacterized protein n=1 Tax=Nostoc minutum NIES-26 TaxID=1844469 RepID=A0A367QWI9_9NOSO|nr:hypothetical protein A6770_22790 [Nostoc minutum NIES-26]
MIYRILLVSTLFSSFLLIQCSQSPAPEPPQACLPGNTSDTAYMWRDKNRCEGIKSGIPTSGGIRLISFASRSINGFSDRLQLQIPNIGSGNPDVSVRSLGKQYQLDNISFKPGSSAFSFSWSTYVLQKEKIEPVSLRALASFTKGSQAVYVPVTIGKSSGEYEFVLYSNSRAQIPTFQIRRDGKSVYTSPPKTSQGGEILFKWNAAKAPAGRYELKYIAELEQFGRPPEKEDLQVLFEHNPDWLK